MSKIITLYNHKGGVSKTTTNFNLAHLLAERGYKTLVIDADPQCNLTELMLLNTIEQLDAEQEDTGQEKPLPGVSILQLLKPRIDGDRKDIEVDDVKTVKINENLELLRGDVDLSDIEDALAESHIQRFSNKTHDKRTYVALGAFLRAYGEKEGFDYILVDVGPSSGALTRACFLICDGFFIPTVPDRFNVQAMTTLSRILDKWMGEHAQIFQNFKDLGLPVALGKPVFLGLIEQNFKLHRGRPRRGYQFWLNRIPQVFNRDLLPVLKKYSTSERDLTCGFVSSEFVAAEIPDLQSLPPLMQEAGRPVFQLTPEDTKIINDGVPYRGKVWEQTEERMIGYKVKLLTLVERIKRL